MRIPRPTQDQLWAFGWNRHPHHDILIHPWGLSITGLEIVEDSPWTRFKLWVPWSGVLLRWFPIPERFRVQKLLHLGWSRRAGIDALRHERTGVVVSGLELHYGGRKIWLTTRFPWVAKLMKWYRVVEEDVWAHHP